MCSAVNGELQGMQCILEDHWIKFKGRSRLCIICGVCLTSLMFYWTVPSNIKLSVTDSLTLDVISISQTTKFLLTGSVPDIKPDWTSVCVKHQRMYFDTQCGCAQSFPFMNQLSSFKHTRHHHVIYTKFVTPVLHLDYFIQPNVIYWLLGFKGWLPPQKLCHNT